MKALFVHDHKFSVDENDNVYSHLMDGQLWKRYLEYFDSLTVIGRSKLVESNNKSQMSGLKPAGLDKVDFCLIGQSRNKIDNSVSSPSFSERCKIIKQQVTKADKIIVRLPSIYGYIASREAIKQNKKYAVEVVACTWDANYYHMRFRNKIGALPTYFIMKHYTKRADAAIYVTDSFLQKRYPCKGLNGIASNVCMTVPEYDVIENRLKKIDGMDKNSVIKFGIVGSMDVKFKGHGVAIEALAKAKDNIPDFELHCIGQGDKARWQKLADERGIGDKMRFDGLLKSGKPVQDWMDSLDVLLIPSMQEGLPRALIEAMSRGLPALGAVTGGIPQLLDDKFLHKKKDHNKLSQDIVMLVNDKELMKKCCRENYEKVKRYDVEILDSLRSQFWGKFYEL